MNICRLILGATFLCALPVFAQPDIKPVLTNGLPYPLVSPEEAVRLVQKDKPIVLHLRDVTLQDAFNELEKQSGVKLDTSWGGDDKALASKLSLDIETRSFNTAFRAIVEEADVKARLQRFGRDGALHVLFNQDPDETDGAPIGGKAPFEFRLQNLSTTFSKSVTPRKTPSRNQSSSLNISLLADPDPQIPLMGSGRPRVTRAEDDKGRSLLMKEQEMPFNAFDMGGQFPLNLNLKAPEADSRLLSHLEGVVAYVLPTKYEKWEVADVSATKELSHEFTGNDRTLRMTIRNVLLSDNQIRMELELSAPVGGDMMNQGRTWLLSADQLMGAMQFKDASGQEFMSGGYSSSGGANSLTVQATFVPTSRRATPFVVENGQMVRRPAEEQPKITAPLSLVLNAPVEFVQTEAPFSFSNLPLP